MAGKDVLLITAVLALAGILVVTGKIVIKEINLLMCTF